MARLITCLVLVIASAALAQPVAPQATDKLPFVRVDVGQKRVVVECEAVNANAAMEFLCVVAGTAEHETVLRTKAKPSDIHLGLLMLGLEPGRPIRYSRDTQKWMPPEGPPLQISVEFAKEGQARVVPAWKLFREIKTKEVMAPRTWIFAGSRVLDGGVYAADTAGYVVTVVNFDLALIDVPWIASSSNELLEYELNPDEAPATGAVVRMIIEPAGAAAVVAPTTAPATQGVVSADVVKVDRLREQWLQRLSTQADAVQQAATEHYRITNELRAEQHRLLDEAERIGRQIEELERRYQDMTVPRPAK